jgi:type II secretory pathway component PulJ
MNKNNQGFTLLILILTLAIVAIIMVWQYSDVLLPQNQQTDAEINDQTIDQVNTSQQSESIVTHVKNWGADMNEQTADTSQELNNLQ